MNESTHNGLPARPDGTAERDADPVLLLAADVGGTSARIAVGGAGALPAAVTGPGANIRSSGPAALAALVPTIERALDGRPGCDVRRAVLAISGAGPARRAEIAATVTTLLAPLGIDAGRIDVLDDLTAAFLAGGVGPDGVLLLAGTGAVAARFIGGELVARTDGMGWLLGDIGSGVWIGRKVLEAVAADVDGRRPRTALTELVGEALGIDLRDGTRSGTGDVRQDLIRAVDPLAPADWGRLAPLPGRALPDPAARRILDRAARALAADVQRLDPGAELPVVLAGSVLTSEGPLREELTTGLDAAGHPALAVAGSGLPGAWRLAIDGAR